MSDFAHCSACDRYRWTGHVCDPVFAVWVPDDGESEADSREQRGTDHEDAAERYAEVHDECERGLLGGATLTVWVRDASGEVKQFEVTGEAVPQYRAYEVLNE